MTNTRKWSASVTAHSHALDLQDNVFKDKDPAVIARSLKPSADHSVRINRAGKNLDKKQLAVSEKVKDELRKLFHT